MDCLVHIGKWELAIRERDSLSRSPRLQVKTCVCVCVRSVVSDSVTPWTIAHQDPLSVAFSRQEYWSALPFPSPLGENKRVQLIYQ